MELKKVIEEIAMASFVPGKGIAVLDCGPVSEIEDMKAAAAKIAAQPGSDVKQKAHGTNWTSPYGSNISHHDLMEIGTPVFLNFIKKYNAPIRSARLNILGPGSGLKQHKETIVLKEGDTVRLRARFHIPLQTTKAAQVFCNGSWYHLEPGRLYFFNNGAYHAAHNGGKKDRVHLVFDLWVNTDVAKVLQSGTKVNAIKDEKINLKAPTDGEYGTALKDKIVLF